MAKKWKDEDIAKYIQSKQVTQETYIAPTVKVSQAPVSSSKNTINSSNISNNDIRTLKTNNLKIAKNNLINAEKDVNKTQKKYEKNLSKTLDESGTNFKVDFKDKSKKQLKYTDKLQTEINSDKPRINLSIPEANKKIQKDIDERNQAFENYKIAKAEYNKAKVDSEDTTFFDKTIGTPIRAITDLGSNLLAGEEGYIKDKSGNKTFLPTYNDLKQQKVRNDTKSFLGGLAQDAVYNGTKILGAGLVDAATGGIGGKALYWSDMASDNYKNVKNQGYNNNQAIANTLISTGSEFLTEKLLGGMAGRLTGGQASEVQNVISNTVNKVLKKPKISNIIGSMGSEALEEFTQEYIGAINDKLTLNKNSKIEDVVKDSMYSAAVGALSAGITTGVSNFEGAYAQNNTEYLKNIISELEEERANVKETTQEKINDTIEQAQNYIDKPFTNTSQETIDNINNSVSEINQDIANTTNNLNLGKYIQNNANLEQNTIPTTIKEDTPINNYINEYNQKQQETETQNKIDNLNKQINKLQDDISRNEKIDSDNSLFDNRNYEEVGKRIINSYQYDNPEVKPYFQETAKIMLEDLKNSIKGEKYTIGDENTYTGQSRNTAPDIEEMLDGIDGKYKLSYNDIEKGLLAIIEDHGAENNVASKRIEFYLDQRLRNGFQDMIFGNVIPPNKEYINLLDETSYNKYISNIPTPKSENDYNFMLQNLKKADVQSTLPTKGEVDFGTSALYKKNNIVNQESQIVLSQDAENMQDLDIKILKPDLTKKELDEINKNLSISEDFVKEINRRTQDNMKEYNNISYAPTDELSKLYKSGGYRTTDEFISLINRIKNEGIDTPIEISVDKSGSKTIENGQHRLYIASKIGLEQLPVTEIKIQNLEDVDINNENWYNKVKGERDEEKSYRTDEKSRNGQQYNNRSYELVKNRGTNERNNRLYNEVRGNNNESSAKTISDRTNLQEIKDKKSIKDKNDSDILYETKEPNDVLVIKNDLLEKPLTKETTSEEINYVLNGDKGESKFFKNITENSKFITEENRNKLSKEDNIKFYDKVTNNESLQEAQERLDNMGENAIVDFFSDKKEVDSVDIATGWILLKRFQDVGDYDSMVEVAKKMRSMGTKSGQAVQAFNIMARLTPEGMVKYAQSELMEAYDRYSKNKSQKWIDENREDFGLTPEETQFIVDTMRKVETMEDSYPKKVELAKIQKMLQDKLPPEKGQGIKSWMRISMLFNPKTQIRNITGNALITPVNAFADVFSSTADKILAKKTGVRTTGMANVGAYLKGSKQGISEATNDFKLGINTKNINQNRFEVGQGKAFNERMKGFKSIFNPIAKAGNKVDSILNYALDVGDRAFSQGVFEQSIQNQLILNNTTEITQDMIDIAEQEALSRTWNDDNDYTKFVLDIRRGLNKIGPKSYGLGDILIPFAKTPANLTKAIVDYSPVGIANTLLDAKKIKNNIETGNLTPQMQHEFVQKLGKATAGTMLYILGYALAKTKLTSGGNDDDKDVSDFMRNTLGIQPYSIKIGNKSFTYDWAQPVAAPFAIMADLEKNKKDEQSLHDAIVSVSDTGFNLLMEQSFMQSINDVLSGYGSKFEKIEQQVQGLPARAIPTFLKQINDMIDSKNRMVYEKNSSKETTINQAKAKIPKLSKSLPVRRDTLGREVNKYGGENSAFNVFINPANINKGKVSDSAKEIYKVYEATKDKTIMPREPASQLKLNNKETSEFLKISGTIIDNNIKKLNNNQNYKEMPDEDKAEVIKGIVDYAYNKAKAEITKSEISRNYKTADKEISSGAAIYDYYAEKISNKNK